MTQAPKRQWKRRKERGAALFVVILVIAMLTGIGLFAAQASVIATSTSGANRVSTQARYFAEGGMNAVMARLSKQMGVDVTLLSRTDSTKCLGQDLGNGNVDPTYHQCLRYTRNTLESQLGFALFTPYNEVNGKHGTLGRIQNANADMLVEMDDLYRLERPVAGFDYTSAGAVNVHFMSVMLHGIGRVRLEPALAQAADSKTLSSTTFRSELVIGPITGP